MPASLSEAASGKTRSSSSADRVTIYPADRPRPSRRLAGALARIPEIESSWSVTGEEPYILKVRLGTPSQLEELLARTRAAANVSTRTTIVLATYYESRPVIGG